MKYFNMYLHSNFKTGRAPCEKKLFNMTNLTPTQKLQLGANRIFGTTIGDGYKSGRKIIKDTFVNTHGYDKIRFLDVDDYLPSKFKPELDDRKHYLKAQFERRRHRILMRGVKLGMKKTVKEDNMSIFTTKK
jgi:hypothetical protein